MLSSYQGFVPLLTAATFGDHGIRAFRQARMVLGERMAWGTMFLGAVLVIGVPGSLQTWVSLAVRDAIIDVAQRGAVGHGAAPGVVSLCRPRQPGVDL